jgi:hypothetical protein
MTKMRKIQNSITFGFAVLTIRIFRFLNLFRVSNFVLRIFCLFIFLSGAVRAQEIFSGTETVPPEVEKMYLKGVKFLVAAQNTEGTWPNQYGSEPAVVGLCVLSILAHGEDPNYGPYAKTIQRGLNSILKSQRQDNGYIGTSMYNHGFSTLALAESYGVVNDPRIGPALQKAVDLILTSQANNPLGAWRYSPEASDADTTVSGAQTVALFAARNAGISVPEEAINKAIRFFLESQSPNGGIGYTGADSPNAARTAIGALVLSLAKKQKTGAFNSAFAFLKSNPANSDMYYHYYLYYAAQAFFRVPAAWEAWNRANIQSLAETQQSDGSWDGSFGPTFSTAASLLSLALNYRFLPIYER